MAQKKISLKRQDLRHDWYIYLIVNCVFLLPVFLITEFHEIITSIVNAPIANEFAANLIGSLFLVYWIPVICYYLFGLTYLHCALTFGVLIYFIYKLIKEKNRELVFHVLFLTIVSIVFNIYWLVHGGRYIGV